jgi:hypothetical protein
MLLAPYVNRQNVFALWPIRLPGADGRIDMWNQSALEAAEMARRTWIRISASRSLGAYEIFRATGKFPNPIWPDADLNTIVRIAFKGRIVDSADHLVVQRLRGLA